MINKKLGIAIVVITLLLISISSWFVFDLNSKIDVLQHPEKYSFRMNYTSFIMQNDYYLNEKYSGQVKTIFKILKTIEKNYENKTDDTSRKIYQLNNRALDLYHDLLSLKVPNTRISNEDFIFLSKNCNDLAILFYAYLATYPELEERSVLYSELNMRKEAIDIVKKDLKDRKINATVSLTDIQYENLTPAYLSESEAPFMKEFEKDFAKAQDSINKGQIDFGNALKKAKNENEALLIKLDYSNKIHTKYLSLLDNLNIKWKHRYLISAIEYKNNKEDKITHLYEIYPYKEGNRIYWNLQYHSPNSEFIKAYLKMLELLINL